MNVILATNATACGGDSNLYTSLVVVRALLNVL